MHVGPCDGLGVFVGEGVGEFVGSVGGRVVGVAERVGLLVAVGVAVGDPEGVPEVLAVVAGAERVGRAVVCRGAGLDSEACGTAPVAGARVGPVSASGPFANVPVARAAAVQTIRTRPTPAPVSSRFPPRRFGGRRRAARPPAASGSGGAAGTPAAGAGSTGRASWSTGVPHPGHDRAPLRCRRHE